VIGHWGGERSIEEAFQFDEVSMVDLNNVIISERNGSQR
jgi:hypothetical protein